MASNFVIQIWNAILLQINCDLYRFIKNTKYNVTLFRTSKITCKQLSWRLLNQQQVSSNNMLQTDGTCDTLQIACRSNILQHISEYQRYFVHPISVHKNEPGMRWWDLEITLRFQGCVLDTRNLLFRITLIAETNSLNF